MLILCVLCLLLWSLLFVRNVLYVLSYVVYFVIEYVVLCFGFACVCFVKKCVCVVLLVRFVWWPFLY